MRITREILLKLAHDTVVQHTSADRSIVSAYLHGSLLDDEPLLGGTADIDLFFVHDEDIPMSREIIPLTDDVHLDIAHHPKKAYRQSRSLRVHPWMGPTLYNCKILYDPQHFLDFVQASVRGQFERPDHVMERSLPQVEQARQIWLSFNLKPAESETQLVASYLRAIEGAANAVALLTGPSLVERRFLLNFAQRAQAVSHPGLYAGLLGLLHGVVELDAEMLVAWISRWEAAFSQVSKMNPPARLAAPRLHYYMRSFESLLYSGQIQVILWPLLNTWTRLASLLPVDSDAYNVWKQACQYLGLLGPDHSERLVALDAYLDTVEELLETWARENGA